MSEDLGLTDAAARYRRHAIAEARDQGHTREQIAAALGVTPPRISQISKGPAAKAPEAPATPTPSVLVQRALPTPPSVRKASACTWSRPSVRASRVIARCSTSV